MSIMIPGIVKSAFLGSVVGLSALSTSSRAVAENPAPLTSYNEIFAHPSMPNSPYYNYRYPYRPNPSKEEEIGGALCLLTTLAAGGTAAYFLLRKKKDQNKS